MQESATPKSDPAADGARFICLQGVHKAFGEHEVLRGVDLDISRGESLVVIGSSGSGKSVLIKHIIGLLEPDAGRVQVDGHECAGPAPRGIFGSCDSAWACSFSMPRCSTRWTLQENVAFPIRQHTDWPAEKVRDRVTEVLGWVGLEGTENKSPAELSGGMKKRVGLARAIALDPEIMLYDEPTTGLDPILGDQINDLILDLAETSQRHVGDDHARHAVRLQDRRSDSDAVSGPDRGDRVRRNRFRTPITRVVQQFIHGRAKGPITTLCDLVCDTGHHAAASLGFELEVQPRLR